MDLVEKDDRTMNSYTEKIRRELGFMKYAPVIFISALTGRRVPKVLELVEFVAEQHAARIATRDLNNLFKEAIMQSPPPTDKTRRLKILYVVQGE